ncbi:hypothetical protein GCM10011452_09600 [Gemmobacter lanyuensis]|uniref:Helix-turn-helix domain-containing protein n=1 Tax=Gemmobacter lanyuensis TaxID=1054497 RepID=A0A918MIF5_9RHOB|nr:DNA-binding protein [Gemmobacter lanyuensis]GGW24196.1 hypothetical protein GCM10011452_09600 [Gemmobacter lanyuensis]
MGQQFVLIEAEALARIERQIAAISAKLEGATLTPAPEWCSIPAAAKRLGVSASTIRRKISLGQLEARGSGKTKQVRLV